VLRAIGVKKTRIMILYFYEAVVLVMASTITGVAIGMFVGYTITLQFCLVLDNKVTIFFPWQQFAIIMILTFICAFLSTVGPTYVLTKK